MTIAIGSMFTVLGTEVLRSYGWGLFVALPFCLGLFSVLLMLKGHPGIRNGGFLPLWVSCPDSLKSGRINTESSTHTP
jgi:hypothetical protein